MNDGPYECENCLSMVSGSGDLLRQVVPSIFYGYVPVYTCPFCECPMFYLNLSELPSWTEEDIQNWLEGDEE